MREISFLNNFYFIYSKINLSDTIMIVGGNDMKRVAKDITLKKDTLVDIMNNNIDTEAYIERIKGYLESANYLVQNKMLDMNSIELYDNLRKVFDIKFEPNDYLKILSLMNKKHYSKYIILHTNMCDENNYNVSYLGAVTNKVKYINDDIIDLKDIRKLTESKDLVLLEPHYIKRENNSNKKEKYESHLYDYINVNNKIIDENSVLYPYASLLVKKNIIIKNVLYDLKIYLSELKHQIRAINGLALVEDDERIANIGRQYKKAYDKATNDRVLPKREKVTVRYHEKKKKN